MKKKLNKIKIIKGFLIKFWVNLRKKNQRKNRNSNSSVCFVIV